MQRSLLVTLALALPTAAAAQSVIACDGWQASAQNIVEPWDQNTRLFGNGAIRIALLDTVEPAAGAFYLLVLTPPYDELGSRTCALIAEDGGSQGFAGIDFAAAHASYNPAIGLTIAMPVQRFQPATGGFEAQQLAVTINQATGSIQAKSWR